MRRGPRNAVFGWRDRSGKSATSHHKQPGNQIRTIHRSTTEKATRISRLATRITDRPRPRRRLSLRLLIVEATVRQSLTQPSLRGIRATEPPPRSQALPGNGSSSRLRLFLSEAIVRQCLINSRYKAEPRNEWDRTSHRICFNYSSESSAESSAESSDSSVAGGSASPD